MAAAAWAAEAWRTSESDSFHKFTDMQRARSDAGPFATSERVQPPATAGMMLTVSPSGTLVSTPSR